MENVAFVYARSKDYSQKYVGFNEKRGIVLI